MNSKIATVQKMTDRYGNKEYLKTEPISIAGIYNFIQNG